MRITLDPAVRSRIELVHSALSSTRARAMRRDAPLKRVPLSPDMTRAVTHRKIVHEYKPDPRDPLTREERRVPFIRYTYSCDADADNPVLQLGRYSRSGPLPTGADELEKLKQRYRPELLWVVVQGPFHLRWPALNAKAVYNGTITITDPTSEAAMQVDVDSGRSLFLPHTDRSGKRACLGDFHQQIVRDLKAEENPGAMVITLIEEALSNINPQGVWDATMHYNSEDEEFYLFHGLDDIRDTTDDSPLDAEILQERFVLEYTDFTSLQAAKTHVLGEGAIAALEDELESKRGERENLEDDIAALEDELESKNCELQELESDIANIVHQLENPELQSIWED